MYSDSIEYVECAFLRILANCFMNLCAQLIGVESALNCHLACQFLLQCVSSQP